MDRLDARRCILRTRSAEPSVEHRYERWTKMIWVRLFKTNDIVSERFVKISSQICQYSNISVFGYKVVKHLTSWPVNELVKLTKL